VETMVNAKDANLCPTIIFYGAGIMGQKIAKTFEKLNIRAECFCDSDPDKHGKIYSGLTVKSINEIKKQYKKGEYKILLTLSNMNTMNVKEELIKNNVFEESDFYSGSYEFYMFDILRAIKPGNDSTAKHCFKRVQKNFIQIDCNQENLIKESLIKHYFKDPKKLETYYGKKNFHDHLYGRLEMYRSIMIPWLDSIHPLKGAKVLEIGCGTGCSTVSLCEQGADVCSIDICEDSLAVAKKRTEIYKLTSQFINLSAENIKSKFSGGFDFIIFSASIEHMTYSERINAIKAVFEIIDENKYVVIFDTPNRLWCIDNHTSLEPFFHWLPDSLAIDYAKYTNRYDFDERFTKNNDENLICLARCGRGLSYHEFEVALGQDGWEVVSSIDDFCGVPYDFFKICLIMNGPKHIANGFYDSTLNFALKKNETAKLPAKSRCKTNG